jgi:hypothetical protein
MQKLIVSFRVPIETNHIKGDNVIVHMSTPYNWSLVIRQVIYNFSQFLEILGHAFIFMDVLNVNYDQDDIRLNKRNAYNLIRQEI